MCRAPYLVIAFIFCLLNSSLAILGIVDEKYSHRLQNSR